MADNLGEIDEAADDFNDPICDNNEQFNPSSERSSRRSTSFRDVSFKSPNKLRAAGTLREESRATVLAAFEEHRRRRLAAKQREETEKRKIMDDWLHEERAAREKQLSQLFTRLSGRRQVAEARARQQIEERIARSRSKVREMRDEMMSRKASVEHAERLKTCMLRKEEIVTKDIAEKVRYCEQKFAKADLVLGRAKEYRSQTVQLNRERREKKTLRSRVQNYLFKEAGGKCDRHIKNSVRYESALRKDELRERKKAKAPHSQPYLDKLVPDEVLLHHFNNIELRHVPPQTESPSRSGMTSTISLPTRKTGTRSRYLTCRRWRAPRLTKSFVPCPLRASSIFAPSSIVALFFIVPR